MQDMANWDPSYPDERVSWYDEYMQRNGPTSINWLQAPKTLGGGDSQAMIEVRGVALYEAFHGGGGGGGEATLAVSPLDDGSVCLWDVRGTRGRKGGILARSKPDVLFIDGPSSQNSRRSKKINTGVTECVSVDNDGHRAFFAVQSHLIEVDLNRLDVVSQESFEWSITTLSAVHQSQPLTVGTTLGVHLHDFRARSRPCRDAVDRVDGQQHEQSNVLRAIFDPTPLAPYASLSQPTPISILHLPRPGHQSLVSDDIYVSGRFSNILHYDRRKFPAIVGSIYSGALISSLATLPHPFSTVDMEVRRRGEFSAERVAHMKAAGSGQTLIAGGSYNNKGSLEMYGLSSASDADGQATVLSSVMKNRQSAASAAILSVINHGTRIVFSDGSGLIKWFERDGSTECRRVRVGHSDAEERSTLFVPGAGSDDLARKILSTAPTQGQGRGQDQDRPGSDNILFWTGDKLGMVSFTSEPLFETNDFDAPRPEAQDEDEKSRMYAISMREALEWQADEVKFMGNMGMRGQGASG
ncbi:F-box domain containing protein [Drechmeria coniospora]|uniref:F-box domain containing protein n=1 Tax=Drechmeria coniospora TaxID=98403 RepID=A0A151GBY9_DRECN|nr:F-box domain containing protein [Drechmeria coniospora]KYK54636.1 F-box domain containing protein [Drechmeria coniospora]